MKKIFSILAIAIVLTGCNFLDKNPDQRATIDSKKKVQLLLVSAYTGSNHFPICETFSDNTYDNNSPDDKGHTNNLAAFSDAYNEMFAWEPVLTSRSQDSPYSIWTGFYSAIASCNYALEAIEKLEAEGEDLSAEKGEALISRAYHHFILVNLFGQAYKDAQQSKNDLGIVYMTTPENKITSDYKRLSVAETYDLIEKDLTDGLSLVSDAYYTVPRYHFNQKAAYAFAARFYLYKRDYAMVEKYANMVLGTTDGSVKACLFDADYAKNVNSYPNNEFYTWIDGNAPSNLLLTTPISYQFFQNFSSYGRYQFTRDAKKFTVSGSGPCWRDQFPGLSAWSYGSEYGVFISKCWYVFEYTDKVAGTGYYRNITRQLTTNECLLNRAEARFMMGDSISGIRDLQLWAHSYDVNSNNRMDTVKEDGMPNMKNIPSFYGKNANKNYAPELHNTDMSSSFIIPKGMEPYIKCVLHFRRIESIHEGLRWFDIKRFGIEIEHIIGPTAVKKTLKWDDDRRAIQLPEEVILAGLEANPRTNVGDNIKIPTSSTPVGSMEDFQTTRSVDLYIMANAQVASKQQ